MTALVAKPTEEKVRFQIDMPLSAARELERLMEQCEIATKKELFNNAITLLDWAIGEVRDGHLIASIDKEGGNYRELQMPILKAACRLARGENLVAEA